MVLLFSISDYMKNTKYQISLQLASLCKIFIFFLNTESSWSVKLQVVFLLYTTVIKRQTMWWSGNFVHFYKIKWYYLFLFY